MLKIKSQLLFPHWIYSLGDCKYSHRLQLTFIHTKVHILHYFSHVPATSQDMKLKSSSWVSVLEGDKTLLFKSKDKYKNNCVDWRGAERLHPAAFYLLPLPFFHLHPIITIFSIKDFWVLNLKWPITYHQRCKLRIILGFFLSFFLVHFIYFFRNQNST